MTEAKLIWSVSEIRSRQILFRFLGGGEEEEEGVSFCSIMSWTKRNDCEIYNTINKLKVMWCFFLLFLHYHHLSFSLLCVLSGQFVCDHFCVLCCCLLFYQMWRYKWLCIRNTLVYVDCWLIDSVQFELDWTGDSDS